jgi:hypothetical protein
MGIGNSAMRTGRRPRPPALRFPSPKDDAPYGTRFLPVGIPQDALHAANVRPFLPRALRVLLLLETGLEPVVSVGSNSSR